MRWWRQDEPALQTQTLPPRRREPDPVLIEQQQRQAEYIARLRRLGYDVDVASRRITPPKTEMQ
jgi:hypothetical protein